VEKLDSEREAGNGNGREKLGMGEESWAWERKAGHGRGDFGCVRERKRFVLAEAGMCRYNG